MHHLQKLVTKKLTKSSDISVITAAEMKISLSMIYFMLVAAMAMLSVTVNEVRNGETRRSFSEYILCTATGNCSLSQPEGLISLTAMADVTNTMLACLPMVIFLLSINVQTCRKAFRACRKAWNKVKSKSKSATELTP